jgi:hypothetical protein
MCQCDSTRNSTKLQQPRRLRRQPQRSATSVCCRTAILLLSGVCLAPQSVFCFVVLPRQQEYATSVSFGKRVSSLTNREKTTFSSTKMFYANSTSELLLSISDVSHSTITRPSTIHTAGKPTTAINKNNMKVYCDMDGVLVDFEKGVYNLLQTSTSNLDKHTMWKNIACNPHWFEKLEWKPDGRRLWKAIKHLQPDILTGVPNIQTSCVDKYNWCKRELQLQDAHHVDMAADGKSCAHESINGNRPRDDATNVITCWSTNKYRECKLGSYVQYQCDYKM